MNLKLIHKAFVLGKPKAQPRPRAFAVGGRARVYNPATAEGWKSEVAQAFRSVAGYNSNNPIEIQVNLWFERPKSHFGTGRNASNVKGSAPVFHTQKPDVDNVAKGILDALVHIKAFHDDSQVITLTISKQWCRIDGSEGAEVVLYEFCDI